MSVAIIDREDPGAMATDAFDSRTVALSAGTRQILEPSGYLARTGIRRGQAIASIDVQEGHDPFILNFNASDAAKADAFGWILPNALVRQTLYDSCLAAWRHFHDGANAGRYRSMTTNAVRRRSCPDGVSTGEAADRRGRQEQPRARDPRVLMSSTWTTVNMSPASG
jgi:2-polyprenyl-6-methoxyphenol hydroxylase-like FAD-dependent oxidoreductase